MIELSQSDTILRAVTNSSGAFSFTHLLTGAWEVRVRRGTLSKHYWLEPETKAILLEPGEATTTDIELVPVARRIQFMDGGTVGTP